jgi:diguanylate cyclase (GGDEF)-like protein/PAS domain S-box-containing protein
MLERALERERRARRSAEDILDRKSSELFELNSQLAHLADMLERREKYAQEILNSVRDGIIVVREDGIIDRLNPAAAEILECSQDELLETSIEEILSLDRNQKTIRAASKMIKPGSVVDAWIRKPAGGDVHIRLAVGQAETESGARKILGLHDLAREDRAVEVLRSQLLHDRLTGLLNAAGLQERFAAVRVAPTCQHLALIVVDLDRFSRINDALGRTVGDQVLVEIARRLEKHAEKYIEKNPDACDFVLARMEGDEFAVLLRGERTAETLLSEIADLLNLLNEPLLIAGTRIDLDARVGYDLQEEGITDLAPVIDNTYLAIEHSRLHGGDRVTRYEKAIVTARAQVIAIEAEIRTGIRNGEFEVFFQPQVHAATGLIRGAEALLRWRHSSTGLQYPGAFIPVAEQSSLVAELGKLAREQVLSFQVRALAEALREPVSINISSVEIRSEGFAEEFLSDVEARDIPFDLIQVELKETVVATDAGFTRRNLQTLNEHFLIALDDFGTGSSSLARLRELPIGMLKVDRGFLRDLEKDSRGRALLTAVMELSDALGTSLVLEGVESAEQIQAVEHVGDFLIQGFYFSPAVPAEEYLNLLREQPWRVQP